MTREFIVTIGLLACIFLGVAVYMIWAKRTNRKNQIAKLRRMWGKCPEREYAAEELISISNYAAKHGNGRFQVDDITWNDLDLDQIFMVMNTCSSSCGEDILYHMLRTPLFDQQDVEKREALIEYFRTHEKERIEIQLMVSKVKKMSTMSVADYIDVLKDVPQKGIGPFVAQAVSVLLAIGVILIRPEIGILLLLVVLTNNAIRHNKETKKIDVYYNCLVCILRLMASADEFNKYENPVISSYLERIRSASSGLQGFRRGSFLVTTSNAMQDGLDAMILSYLKICFHVDLIKFYSMIKHVSGHEKDINELYETIGELDALIAMASFREWLPYYAKPEFREMAERKADEHVSMEVHDLYHPMIENPVANSITIKKGVLVTGSNASGKSTFLKTLAINAILAQTALISTSTGYRADYMKVMTSMALRDSLESGESYYIVEIKSLQRILEECKKKEPILCIVDEVLRGTNTIERIAASSQILRSLTAEHVLPMAATHDIELSYILQDDFDNYHFEEEIKDHDVIFNYILQKGRATTRNAIRLLEMIGYDKQIVQEAQEAAAHFEATGEWR